MNLIADIFGKMGRKLYYYRKDSGLEVDFVMRFRGECTLVEVKASSGNVKSTKTILAHPKNIMCQVQSNLESTILEGQKRF